MKLKDWASFFSFFLRSPCTKIFHYQHMIDKSINISTQIKLIHSSIFINTRKNIGQLSRKSFTGGRYYLVYLCTLAILNSADCHPKRDSQVNLEYPCGKEVLDDHAGIHCGYYRSCINTVNNTYNILSKSNISWIYMQNAAC